MAEILHGKNGIFTQGSAFGGPVMEIKVAPVVTGAVTGISAGIPGQTGFLQFSRGVVGRQLKAVTVLITLYRIG